jgi:hypothetical protein
MTHTTLNSINFLVIGNCVYNIGVINTDRYCSVDSISAPSSLCIQYIVRYEHQTRPVYGGVVCIQRNPCLNPFSLEYTALSEWISPPYPTSALNPGSLFRAEKLMWCVDIQRTSVHSGSNNESGSYRGREATLARRWNALPVWRLRHLRPGNVLPVLK